MCERVRKKEKLRVTLRQRELSKENFAGESEFAGEIHLNLREGEAFAGEHAHARHFHRFADPRPPERDPPPERDTRPRSLFLSLSLAA